MGNTPSRGYSEFVSSDNHQHRRGRSSHRRRRSGSHGIPPPAPSPPPAYQEYPVPRSPPRTTRTTPGGYTYTTRGLSPIREQRRPSPIRRTTSPWGDPLRREPRRVYVTRPHDDPMFFMSGARGALQLSTTSKTSWSRSRSHKPSSTKSLCRRRPVGRPIIPAGGPGPSTYYDRPDTNGFRPRRDAFDTGFGLGSGSGPSYTRSGGGAGGLYDRPRRTFFSSSPSYSAGPSNRYRDQQYPGSGYGYRPDRGSWR
ncbi:hypothetical protein LTR47_007089 [Exophiala xenobiotica]|nr:hypothetical protein LTR47_007089 [Exophiala xenobiotica]KAK5252897.1 hypothetical protein LTS06_002609 [Exophiala xenobiotica]KAK5353773.1 hypothetical protein LTR61_002467 [Exophiala xenobiotica]KAK5370582.1 hypothetical protein LTR11_006793 [Exophiala xenobiotica]